MSGTTNTVTVEVVGGTSLTVPWVAGMTGQAALEAARDQAPANTLNFALEYFGKTLGYMVIMLNGTYESFLPLAAPNYYWDFLVNDVSSAVGIDSVKLNAGDKVSFSFDRYDPSLHAQTTLAAKYKARS
jgi:hypothetical protein